MPENLENEGSQPRARAIEAKAVLQNGSFYVL
jgi:hypothetical protein